MINQLAFALKEALRNIKNNKLITCNFFVVSFLLFFLQAVLFITFINSYYLLEVYTTKTLSKYVVLSLVKLVDNIHKIKYVQMFLSLFIFISLFFVNKKYLLQYLNSYQNEIKLIIRIDGNKKIIKNCLRVLNLLINLFAVFLVISIFDLIYGFLHEIIVKNYIGFSLLHFYNFKVSLLIFLLINVCGNIVLVSDYLYWQIKRW